jgi:hypothetical protein
MSRRPKFGRGSQTHGSGIRRIQLRKAHRVARAHTGTPTLAQQLSSDHDPLFEFYRCKADLRVPDVSEIKTVAHVRLSHPFVERVIGTVRRELSEAAALGKKISSKPRAKFQYPSWRTQSSRQVSLAYRLLWRSITLRTYVLRARN